MAERRLDADTEGVFWWGCPMRQQWTLVGLIGLVLGCQDAAAPAPAIDPTGGYHLTTVNGQALPVTLVQQPPPNGSAFAVYSGTLSISPGGAYTANACYSPVTPCQFEALEAGTWRQFDKELVLTTSDGFKRTLGFASASRLVEAPTAGNFAGLTLTFER